MKADERQVGGAHYKQKDGGEEHWTRVARLGLDYFAARITAYVERCWDKNGVEDLKKAQHFLEKYIEIHTSGRVVWEGRHWTQMPPMPLLDEPLAQSARFFADAPSPEDAPPREPAAVAVERIAMERRVTPSGWTGYVFEGADSKGFLFTCKNCNEKFYAPAYTDPSRAHAFACSKYPDGFLKAPHTDPDTEPSSDYTNQD